jgi:hypothetical protein
MKSDDLHYVYVSDTRRSGYYAVVPSRISTATISDGTGSWISLTPITCFECGHRCTENPPSGIWERWFCADQCALQYIYTVFYTFEDIDE